MASIKAMRVYAKLYWYVMGALSIMGVYTLWHWNLGFFGLTLCL